MTSIKSISEQIRAAILANESSYSLAGLWSGGAVAIVNSQGDKPMLYFQVKDKKESWGTFPKLPEGLEIKSLTLSISGEDAVGVALAPRGIESIEPFLSLVDYLFERLVFQKDMAGHAGEVFDEVVEWIAFWKISGKKPLREVVMGLVGELLTITNLLDHKGLKFDSWEGPRAGNHDFRAFGNSIEVKVCGSRSGGLVHKISSQRQLESPDQGKLFLHSLRLQLGKNLPHKVLDLISNAKSTEMFRESEGAAYFDESISQLLSGELVPEEIATYELLDQHLFLVDNDFPKIQGNSLPSGVIDVTYSIDLTSLADEETRALKRSFSLETCDWV